jgi:hypothetical protein
MESTAGARPTTTVQDLAAGAPDVPARFVAREHHNHDQQTATAPVPVIHVGRLFQQDGSGAAVDEAAKLRSALESWGLFLVTFSPRTPPFWCKIDQAMSSRIIHALPCRSVTMA